MLTGQSAVSRISDGVSRIEDRRVARRARFTPEVFMKEGAFTIKTLTEDDEKIEAYLLRHRVFAEELGWVPATQTLMEIDDYDKEAIFLGVFNERDQLVAFARLILTGGRFMIEEEFSSLIGSWHTIRRQDDTAEVSRLCVSPDARTVSVSGNFGVHHVSMLLYKGIFQLCRKNNIRYIYIVVEYKIFRMFLAKGFQCRLVGEPLNMADGCVAVAAIVDFNELVSVNSVKRPAFAKWFTQYRSDRSPSLPQPPESCSRLAASA